VAVRNVFISYARANKPDVDQLERHLRELGCNAWLDSWLHGSQDWWQEILRRIEGCDVFIPIISEEALNSVACNREFDWAEALRKPVLPVRMEPTSIPLPRRYSIRQIVDYSDRAQRDHAPIKLASALMSLPPPPPLPQPLPSLEMDSLTISNTKCCRGSSLPFELSILKSDDRATPSCRGSAIATISMRTCTAGSLI
jgi:TIR domain